MPSITAQVSNLFQKLSPGQQKVALFIHDNAGHICFLSASQLAEKIGVSNATVSRFVRMLGYPDYGAFRQALASETMAGRSTATRLAESAEEADRNGGIPENVFSQDIKNIVSLRETIHSQPFEQAVFCLSRARRIYILGLRSTFSLAYYLAFYLRFFLTNVVLIELGRGNYTEEFIEANEEDALVAVSFHRYTRQTVELQKSIKDLGPMVIGISDSQLSPIAAASDISLTTPVFLPTYFESLTAPMSLINALLAAVALQMHTEAMPALNRLELTLDVLNIYC
jgi:DNA-binding MurR/RpiR family transcriptional regulator